MRRRRSVLARPRAAPTARRSRRMDHEQIKAEFHLWLNAGSSGKPWVREHYFHPARKWRFDFAHPGLRIAIEIEGLTTGIGGHQTIDGYRKNCYKYNEACLLGWRLFRFTYEMLRDDRTYKLIDLASKQGVS